MANTPKALHRGLLTATTDQVVGTVPAGRRWILTNLILCNYGSTGLNVYVKIGGFSLVHAVLLTPASTFTLDCTQVLEAGDEIRAWASGTNSVTMHASGVEMEL